jgi:hypothetical protein
LEAEREELGNAMEGEADAVAETALRLGVAELVGVGASEGATAPLDTSRGARDSPAKRLSDLCSSGRVYMGCSRLVASPYCVTLGSVALYTA